MNKFLIIAILAFSYVSAQRYRCMDKLDGSPAGKCLVIDYIGIHYVSSCKTGKVCDENDDNEVGWAQCTNVKLPGFDGQACTDNAECLSNNCDGSKCAEKDGNCINDLACERGRYCDEFGKCKNMKSAGQECESSKECNPYHICNYDGKETKCVKVGSQPSGTLINNDMGEFEALICSGGINNGGKCDKITADGEVTYKNGELKLKTTSETGGFEVDYRENLLTGSPYPEWNKKKSDLFADYITEVNDNERDPDDGVWEFGANRVTGDKKKVKEALIKYMYPELSNEDDDEIECVRKYMQQIHLSSKSINVSKYLLLLVALFL